MAFILDKSELATEFKKRIAVAETGDLIAAIPVMRKNVYFAAQLPSLLEELERRGYSGKVCEPKNPHRLAKAFVTLLAGMALVILFFKAIHGWAI